MPNVSVYLTDEELAELNEQDSRSGWIRQRIQDELLNGEESEVSADA